MLHKSVQEYLSRLLLTFSDLCDTDEEIAECLNLMQVPTRTVVRDWNASMVRAAMPAAYVTVSSASDYATTPIPQTLKICRAIYTAFKEKERQKE